MERRLPSAYYPLLAALIAGLLYLVFLTRNPVVDAVYYAWCGRYGHELAHSHHLLYNYWLRAIMLICGGAGDNTIYLFQAANALAGAACIGLLCSILQKNGLPSRSAFWLSLAVAGCWGFARFATDNEAYVMPILFSLIALRLVISSRRFAWLAGLFSAIAILFHQVQVWWALPMLWLVWKRQGFGGTLDFYLWHLLVPAAYTSIWALDSDQSLHDFFLGEFQAGGVHSGWGVTTIAKTAVQTVRSVFQLHELMFYGLPHPILVVPVILLIGGLLLANFLFTKKVEDQPATKEISILGLILIPLLIAFSFFSQGNAEFLAGLPFAAAFWLSRKDSFQRIAPGLAASIWIWNSAFGHRITVFYQIEPDRRIAQIVHTQKVDAFLLMRKLEVDWWYAYQYGTKPQNTCHMQWLAARGTADKRELLYDAKPVAWHTVIYEDGPFLPADIFTNLGLFYDGYFGIDSSPIVLPGYKQQSGWVDNTLSSGTIYLKYHYLKRARKEY